MNNWKKLKSTILCAFMFYKNLKTEVYLLGIFRQGTIDYIKQVKRAFAGIISLSCGKVPTDNSD